MDITIMQELGFLDLLDSVKVVLNSKECSDGDTQALQALDM